MKKKKERIVENKQKQKPRKEEILKRKHVRKKQVKGTKLGIIKKKK